MMHNPRLLQLLTLLVVMMLGIAACTTDELEDVTDDTVEDAPDATEEPTAASDDPGDAEPTEAAAEPTEATDEGGAEGLNIAFFASSSQNGYNQAVYEGVQEAAAEAGDVQTEIFDGEFNADVQFNQIEDIVASGRFDGFVVVPNDTVGIEPVIQQAIDEGLGVATALFPIGPDLGTIEPQVDGIITAAAPVEPQSEELAQGVVDYCADIDPYAVWSS